MNHYLDLPAERFLKDEELLHIFTTAVSDELNVDLEERIVNAGLKIEELEDKHNVLLEMLVNRERELRLLSEIFQLFKTKCQEIENLHSEIKEESSNSQESFRLLKEFNEQLEQKYSTQSDYLNEIESNYRDCKIKLDNAALEIESLKSYKEKFLDLEKEDEVKTHEFEKLKYDFNSVIQKLDDITKENAALQEANETLRIEADYNIQLTEENDNLLSTNTSLKRNYEAALKEISNLRNQVAQLTKKEEEEPAQEEKKAERKESKEAEDDNNINAKIEGIKKGHYRRPTFTSDLVGTGRRLNIYEVPFEEEENHTNNNVENHSSKELAALNFDSYDHFSMSDQKITPRSRANHKSMDFDNISPNKSALALKKKAEERERARTKDMFEEYYALTYSSVLMNFEFFDEILEFEGKKKTLYDEIKRQDLPYHKWYKWIDGELHKYYQSLHAKKAQPEKKAPVIAPPTKLGQQKRKILPSWHF